MGGKTVSALADKPGAGHAEDETPPPGTPTPHTHPRRGLPRGAGRTVSLLGRTVALPGRGAPIGNGRQDRGAAAKAPPEESCGENGDGVSGQVRAGRWGSRERGRRALTHLGAAGPRQPRPQQHQGRHRPRPAQGHRSRKSPPQPFRFRAGGRRWQRQRLRLRCCGGWRNYGLSRSRRRQAEKRPRLRPPGRPRASRGWAEASVLSNPHSEMLGPISKPGVATGDPGAPPHPHANEKSLYEGSYTK